MCEKVKKISVKTDVVNTSLVFLFYLQWETPGGEVSYMNTTPKVVREGAVIGGGTMGSGIAICFITNGIPVKLVEANQKVYCLIFFIIIVIVVIVIITTHELEIGI